MKFRNIILFAAIVVLCQCKEDEPEPTYSNEQIVTENAQATMYFHTIFREAENAWAFIDSVQYIPGTYEVPATRLAYKKLTYNESTKTVTVEYNAWVSGYLLLVGTIAVTFDKSTYGVNSKVATIKLTDFSIEGQTITGSSSITYKEVAEKTTDNYIFKLTEGAIHAKGDPMQVLMTNAINSGQYERTEGGNTTDQKNDLWAYSGSMTGMMHEDPNMDYTNTVLTSYMDGTVTKDGTVNFSINCKTAKQGVSQIKIPGRSDIIYEYLCSNIGFVSVTRVE